jgi:hypothetical protein
VVQRYTFYWWKGNCSMMTGLGNGAWKSETDFLHSSNKLIECSFQ